MDDWNGMQTSTAPLSAADQIAPLPPRRGRARTWPTSAMPDLGRPALPASGQSSFVASNTAPTPTSSASWTPGFAPVESPSSFSADAPAVPAPYVRDDWQWHRPDAWTDTWSDAPSWTEAPATPRNLDAWAGVPDVVVTDAGYDHTTSQWRGEVAVPWNARPEAWQAPAQTTSATPHAGHSRLMLAAAALAVLAVLSLVITLI